MTIDAFMNNYNIKKKETVIKWIIDDLIPGANLSAGSVPDSARPPYTKARAKSAKAIYCSIVAATRKRLHVLPQLYKMCTDEFNGYIERLEGAGLIVRRITDNITYYDLPISSTNYSRNYILAAIEAYSKGAWQGITTALLNQQNAV